jgi:fimbrial isopeptide formation D2 family protein/LPXTG-motif cell wall-anchored protein
MKMMKKVMALILSMLMIVSLAMPIAGDETTPTITIENAVAGTTYTAYKIFDVTYDAEKTTYAYTISNISPWYDVVNAYANENSGLTLTVTKADSTVFNVSVDTSKFSAAAFAEYLKGKVTSTPPSTPEVTDAGTSLVYSEATGTATATVPSLGYYFVTSTAGSLCNLTTTNPTASIFDKNAVTFDKTVDDIDVEIGQTVNYTLNGVVPNATGYTKYVYKVSDKLSSGLTLNKDVKVKVGESEITLITIEDDTAELNDRQIRYRDDGFDLYFDMASSQNSIFSINAPITITYSATVNKNAVKGNEGNPNTATLEYSNDPTNSKSTDKITDKEIVYTVDIEILKHKTGDENTKLSGASFILYRISNNKNDKTEAATTQYYKYDSTNNVVSWVDETKATTFTTDTNGAVKFVGIQANSEDEAYSYEYYLRETVAPEGYNLLEEDIKVNINRKEVANSVLTGDEKLNDTHTSTITMTETTNEGDVTLTDTVVKVGNSSGSALPETGGIGTTIFYVVGGIMMVVAIVLLVTKKKMSKK